MRKSVIAKFLGRKLIKTLDINKPNFIKSCYISQHQKFSLCSNYVTYAFQSESTRYSCLNVKELLTRNRCNIWSLSDCNWTGTHNHLVRKRTLTHLVKLAQPVWLNGWVFVYKLSGCGFHFSRSHQKFW